MRNDLPTLRVVLDTNILFSGIIVPHGNPAAILKAWSEWRFAIVFSAQHKREISETLNSNNPKLARYHVTPERIAKILEFVELAEMVDTETNHGITVRDAKDQAIFDEAMDASVDVLVSGDDDLLSLSSHPNLGSLRILTPREFLEFLDEQEARAA